MVWAKVPKSTTELESRLGSTWQAMKGAPVYYSTICIKEYGDRSNPGYYPQIDEEGHFIPEPGDNSAVSAGFTNLLLRQNSKTVFESEHGLDGKLFITDARIVLICDDYESGGFLWIGNPLITAVAGVASTALARSRTAGKVLTGHIRYEWIKGVVPASEKLPFNLVDETITIDYRDPFGSECSLAVTLKNVKGVAGRISAEIRKRFSQHERQCKGERQRSELPAARNAGSPSHKYCKKCGGQIKEPDVYCRHCGSKQKG